MASLVPRVKSKLFIRTSHKSMHALDGAYASLLRGRSSDFEDLREYEQGDEMRDIDWRATARLSTLLVKRTRATRLHTVLFVVDTGRALRAAAQDERPKSELAILATGVLGLLAVRHGDEISLVCGDRDDVRRLAPGRSEEALEHALRTIERGVAASTAPSDRDALLSYVARTVRRRAIVVVVTDEAPVTERAEGLLRRLRVQHDVLWLTLRDADPVVAGDARRARHDVDTGWEVPEFLQGDADVIEELAERRRTEDAHRAEVLSPLGVGHTALSGQDRAVPELLRMLNGRAHVRA